MIQLYLIVQTLFNISKWNWKLTISRYIFFSMLPGVKSFYQNIYYVFNITMIWRWKGWNLSSIKVTKSRGNLLDSKNLSSVYGDNTEMQTQPETENLGFSIELTVTTCTNSLTLFSVMSDPLWTHGLLGSGSAYGIFQTRILEWVAISPSRGSSQPRNWDAFLGICCISCTGRQVFYH